MIQVALWTKHEAAMDPGYRYSFDTIDEFTNATVWLMDDSFDRMEIWIGEDD